MSTSVLPGTSSTSLLRVLGLIFGIAVLMGGTLGVGILRQPGPVAAYLREPSLIMLMWLGGAVYSALGVLNVAELATMIPRAGGFYVFARESMGDTAGFTVGWSDFLANTAATAYGATAIVEFLSRVVPSAAWHSKLIASTLLLMFAVLQWFGIRLSGIVQQVAAATAATALLALVAACFALPGVPGTAAPVAPASGFAAAMVLAIQSIVVTYDGWYGPIYFTEETQNPARQIPRAMFFGLALVTAIYILLNFAFLRALGPAGLASSKFAAADAANRIFGQGSDMLLSIVACIILMTMLHVVILTGTRIVFAVSRDGLVWDRAAEVAPNGTPRIALLISTSVSLSFVLTGTVDRLIAMAGFFYVANYCWSYLSLIVLRHRQPNAPRPFRTPFYPLSTLIALGASLAFLTGAVLSDRRNSLYALLLLLASYPIRLLLRASRVSLQ
jgi:APA family basic amino acid/polyamine antiporter